MSKTDRTAFITGSGRNIGRAVALELASRGFNIVLNGSTNRDACEQVAKEVQSLGGVASHIAMGSIGDREQVRAIAKSALDEFGRVDVLVNNAAIRPNFNFLEDSEDEWERVQNTNFKSVFWLSRSFLPGMIDQGWGRIINFTGMNAQQGYPGKSAVSVSKHAAWGLTKSIAKEFGPKGVTCNIISPGTIVGEENEPEMAKKFDALKSANPSGRLGVPADIAASVGYLVGDQSGFVNGQILQINGGVVG